MKVSKADNKAKINEVRDRLRRLSEKPSVFDQARMAKRAEDANVLLHDAFNLYRRLKGKDEEEALWKESVELFNECIESAYPAEFWHDFELLKKGDTSGLETAIKFLECDPWFFRSGYVKADLIRMVCRCPLTASQAQRLQKVVLSAVELRDRREFRQFANLGRKVRSPQFCQDLSALLLHPDQGVRRRAGWVLEAMRAKGDKREKSNNSCSQPSAN